MVRTFLLILGTNQWVGIYVWQILGSALDLQKTQKKNLASCCNCFKESQEDNSSKEALKAFEMLTYKNIMYLQRIFRSIRFEIML